MRETGAILVPTRTIIEDMLESKRLPDYAEAKMIEVAERHAEAIALAHDRGVTVAMGTDIAMTGSDLPDSWGRNGARAGPARRCSGSRRWRRSRRRPRPAR